jgi:ankyrin repeat protein
MKVVNVLMSIALLLFIVISPAYACEITIDSTTEQNKIDDTPLHTASWKNNIELMKKLIQEGTDVNVQDSLKETPLFSTVRLHDKMLEATKLLLMHGASVSVKNINGDTSLHDAVSCNSPECVKLLIAYGADLNIKNNYGRTPREEAEFTECLTTEMDMVLKTYEPKETTS